jgi:uncharacterized membrane protein YfcA
VVLHQAVEGRRVPGVTTNPQAEAERRMGHRIVIGILVAVPLFATLFALITLAALHNSDAPMAAALVIGGTVGALAGSFAGFWVATVISGPDFEA